MDDFTIVKLGGSAITTKDSGLAVREEVVKEIGQELASSGRKIIILHGAGSFGHPIAKKYGIKDGNREKPITSERRLAASRTRAQVHLLHQQILDSMLSVDLPVFSFPISASSIARSGQPEFSFRPVKLAIERGFVPVLYGDVVLDEDMGFTIISGDEIMFELSDFLTGSISEAIFISDVGGLYTSDPKAHADAKLIDYHQGSDFTDILDFAGESAAEDVTGGMRGKILNIAKFLQKGISVKIVSGFDTDNLSNALTSDKFKGSLFIP